MKTHAFFVEGAEAGFPAPGGSFSVADPLVVGQWSRVLRFAPGEEVMLYDGKGWEAKVAIRALSAAEAKVEVLEVGQNAAATNALKRDIRVCLSIIKGDRLEWAIQKCAELGVSSFVPVIADRTIKKDVNLERARKIASEACEQSMNASIMSIAAPVSLEAAIEGAKREGRTLVFCDIGSEVSAREILSGDHLALFIGPEGGFSEKEVLQLSEAGAVSVGLGVSVLRAETAAIAAASVALI